MNLIGDTMLSLITTKPDHFKFLLNSLQLLLGNFTCLVLHSSGWQPRWFVLENGVISYYDSEDDVGKGSKGSIKMSVCDIKGGLLFSR